MARRYASALADVVTERGEAREVREELSQWEEMVRACAHLAEVFRNPTIPYEQKRRVLNALIARTRVRPTTANFLQVLLKNQRLAELHEVNQSFARELDRRAGTVTAHVMTARPVTEQARRDLERRLSEMTRRTVRMEFSTDEGLIGGTVTRIGSTVYDGSVRTQLQQIKQRMVGEKF